MLLALRDPHTSPTACDIMCYIMFYIECYINKAAYLLGWVTGAIRYYINKVL